VTRLCAKGKRRLYSSGSERETDTGEMTVSMGERIVEFRENIPSQVAAAGDATFPFARVFRMQPRAPPNTRHSVTY